MSCELALETLRAKVGTEVHVSPGVEVTQERVARFADATGDHQWIHVDPVRAAAGPFGTTIAHGYLTLWLVPEIAQSAMAIDDAILRERIVNWTTNADVQKSAATRMAKLIRDEIDAEAYAAMRKLGA